MPVTKRKRSKANSKKMASAQDRLKRLQETIAPYSRPPMPQVRVPRAEWVPGEYANVRENDDIGDNVPHLVAVE